MTIDWKRNPDKRRFLAACRAFTNDWSAITKIWSEKYPGDSQACGDDRGLQGRLNAQYYEHKKNKEPWASIVMTPEHYRTVDAAIGNEIIGIASRLNIHLLIKDHMNSTSANVMSATTTSQTSTMRTVRHTAAAGHSRADVASRSIHKETQHVSARPAVGMYTPATNRTVPPVRAKLSDRKIKALPPPSLEFQDFDQERFRPITASESHPGLPAVLFRFSCPEDANGLGPRGFFSYYHRSINSGYTDSVSCTEQHVFTMVRNHIDEKEIRIPGNTNSHLKVYEPSPFISAADRLFWSFRLALRLHQTKPNLRMTLLDGKIAGGPEGTRAYYAKPYADQIKARKAFGPGKWLNAASVEFLFWCHIPMSAVIVDFSLEDIWTICTEDYDMARLLRPMAMIAVGDTKKTTKSMKLTAPFLDNSIVSAMARLIMLMCGQQRQNFETSPDHVTQLVCDLVEGWHVMPAKPFSNAEWYSLANMFASVFKDLRNKHFTLSQRDLRRSFLFGVKSGFGLPHWQYTEEGTRKMMNKSAYYGLTDPDFILAAEEDPFVATIRAANYTSTPATAREVAGIRRSAPKTPRRTYGQPVAVPDCESDSEDSEIYTDSESMTESLPDTPRNPARVFESVRIPPSPFRRGSEVMMTPPSSSLAFVPRMKNSIFSRKSSINTSTNRFANAFEYTPAPSSASTSNVNVNQYANTGLAQGSSSTSSSGSDSSSALVPLTPSLKRPRTSVMEHPNLLTPISISDDEPDDEIEVLSARHMKRAKHAPVPTPVRRNLLSTFRNSSSQSSSSSSKLPNPWQTVKATQTTQARKSTRTTNDHDTTNDRNMINQHATTKHDNMRKHNNSTHRHNSRHDRGPANDDYNNDPDDYTYNDDNDEEEYQDFDARTKYYQDL